MISAWETNIHIAALCSEGVISVAPCHDPEGESLQLHREDYSALRSLTTRFQLPSSAFLNPHPEELPSDLVFTRRNGCMVQQMDDVVYPFLGF
jgi:predicted amidohydrolase YtcJ